MNETNINVICRLCLNNSFLHSNIFAGPTTDCIPTYQIINYAYDLQISADDGLPEYICENCYTLVKAFQVYKTNAHKAKSEIMRMKQEMLKSGDVMHRQGDKDAVPGHNCSSAGTHNQNASGGEDVQENVAIGGDANGEENSSINVFVKQEENSIDIGCNSELDSPDYQENFGEREIFVKQEDNSIDVGSGSKSGSPAFQENYAGRENYMGEDVDRFGFPDAHFANQDNGREMHDPSKRMSLEHGSVQAILREEVSVGLAPEVGKGRRKYRCHICSKCFVDKGSLIAHSTMHSGEKIFECTECLKRFKTKGSLMTHSRIHVAVKPYGCDVCWKRFSRKDTLTSHLVTHTNDRPYKCHLCEKRYTFKRALRRHLKVHNPAEGQTEDTPLSRSSGFKIPNEKGVSLSMGNLLPESKILR